jgi:hypothetical protein
MFDFSRPELRVWANSDSEMQRFESSRLSQPRCLRLPSLIELKGCCSANVVVAGARYRCISRSTAASQFRAASADVEGPDSEIRGARQQPHWQLIDHGHVECIERPPASASGLHILRSLYH